MGNRLSASRAVLWLAPVVLGLAPVLLAGQSTSPQTPQATFRAAVEVVDVDVSVLDKHRLPVRDLAASDFTVLEDGHPRPIVAFTAVDLPPRVQPPAPWMAEVVSDVQSNNFPREGRLIVILMDRSLTIDQLPHARAIAEAAINQMRDGDLAAVAYSSYGIPQNFTADRRRLLAAVRQPLVGLPADDRGAAGDCFCGACTLETIERIADAIQDVRQRRKMLFFVGNNIAILSNGPCSAVLMPARDRVLRTIGAGNLTVYSFDPSGVQTLTPGASSRTPSNRQAMANLMRVGNLMVLPDHTGGRLVSGNQPSATMPEVFRESNSYCVLGFTPSHADGRFHDIKVRVARSGVILQARRGYVAAGGTPKADRKGQATGIPPLLRNAITGIWPTTHIPLTISAVPIAASGLRTANVAVLLGVGQLPPEPTTLDVMVGAYDRNGEQLASALQRVPVSPRRGEATVPVEIVSRLELKPGRYELRAAVADPSQSDAGSVYTYIDVPDFSKEFVSMSGMFLGVDAAASTTAPGDPLPFAPTMRRQFAATERVSAYLQIYQGLRRAAMPGYVTSELRNDQDQRVFRQETRTLAADVGANRATSVSLDLPLRGLAPGEYLFTVDVRQGNETASRDVRFSVR